MRIVAREPMNLLRELAREGLTTEATDRDITVTGASLAAVAQAIQRAIVRAGDPVAAVVQESVPVAHSRAALAGDERAAYDAAYMARTRALAAARAPASAGAPLVAEAVPGPEPAPFASSSGPGRDMGGPA
jgi:flavin-binding protein dodecin